VFFLEVEDCLYFIMVAAASVVKPDWGHILLQVRQGQAYFLVLGYIV
jgi:hypothetical protein